MRPLQFILVLFIFWACNSKSSVEVQEETEAAEAEMEEQAVPATITASDSAYVNGLISQLNGIEKFGVGRDFGMMASLLAFKGDSSSYQRVHSILEKTGDYVQLSSIHELDTKNGYMVYAPIGAEVTYTKVYWNMKDGSQLLATEAWGCGPVCSSDIYFSRYSDGVFTSLERDEIIPDNVKLPKMIMPDFNPDDPNADPVEFKYVLPQRGKNIKFCLEENCIELVWNEGTFIVKDS